MNKCQITVFEKNGGPLTKRISLVDGKPVSDGSDCLMAHGIARRAEIGGMPPLAHLINNLTSNQAYALGRIRDGHPDHVEVVPTAKLNGATDPTVIARSKKYLVFSEGEPGLVLLDVDLKAIPEYTRCRMEECGGPWSVLCAVLPAFKIVARVERASTSSGLRNKETGETFPTSGGLHIVVPVRDASDIQRFLSYLHDLLWLAGWGWGMPSEDGRFLERSLIDKTVGTPEHLIFEGPPIVKPPLVQEKRDAVAYNGDVLDTRSCWPPLSDRDKSTLKKLKAAERERLKPELKAARETWTNKHVEQLTPKGMSKAAARELVDRWLDWQELTGEFELLFDDPNIGAATVADTLAAPDKYVGESLSDPFAGPGYGRCKAKLYQRSDGSLFIKSYAHGGIYYELKANITAGLVLPRGFKLNDEGLWFRSYDEDAPPIKVCGPFNVEARTSGESHNNHGLLLKWTDHDGEQHAWPMPRRMVHTNGNEIAVELEDAGLSCGTSHKAHEYLKQFLGGVGVQRHMHCVERAGWHGNSFVMPDGRVLGADANSVVLQTAHVVKTGRYAERGTLKEWQDNIARYAVGNHLLALTISGAFVAPLLDILGESSRGGNLSGQSQTGKTTLVRCSISVYGPAEEAYLRTWRATANGLEGAAAETNHLLMTLDELGQANPYEAGSVVYMLGNSTGKQRANRAGGARQPHNWLTFFWSTGETTLAAKLAEAGRRARAGMDVRMVEVAADAGRGMGVWQDLLGLPSGAALSNHLRAASRTYCGTAGLAFLDRLARDRADNPVALTETLRKLRQKFLDDLLPKGADGQVQSVAAFFALIGAAGELAAAYDVLPWEKGQALRSAGFGFKRWLAARGGAGAGEDIQALEQVRAFIAAHGASRFEVIDNNDDDGGDDDDDCPKEQRVINRAGFKLIEGGVCEYLILPDAWRKDVCAGLDPTQAAKALKQEDLLIPDTDGRHLSAVRRCGMYGTIRGYCIRGQILGDDEIPGDDQ